MLWRQNTWNMLWRQNTLCLMWRENTLNMLWRQNTLNMLWRQNTLCLMWRQNTGMLKKAVILRVRGRGEDGEVLQTADRIARVEHHADLLGLHQHCGQL